MKAKLRPTKEDYDNSMRRGDEKGKPCCCYEPDYLDAYHDFKYSADGYLKLELFEDYVRAVDKIANCNSKMRIRWDEAMNYKDIAYVYWRKLDNMSQCVGYMRLACIAFQLDGKLRDSITIFSTLCRELIPTKQFDVCNELLVFAFGQGIKHFEDDLVQMAMEETFVLFIDVTCELQKYVEGLKEAYRYLNAQQKHRLEKRAILKTYVVIAMLRIIIKEVNIAESLIKDMIKYIEKGNEYISDLMKLINSFKNDDRNAFNYCLQYAFSLFPNGLLKGLRRAFDQKNKNYSFVSSNNISGLLNDNENFNLRDSEFLNKKKTKDKRDSLDDFR